MRHPHRQHDDDDNIIKDGERVRVNMTMMDSLQRDVRQHVGSFSDAEATLDKAYADAETIKLKAYDDYVKDLTNAWKPKVAIPASAYPLSAGEGTACIIDGAPGTLVREGDWLVCRPTRRDSASVGDAEAIKLAAYDEYVDRLTNAWRGGR